MFSFPLYQRLKAEASSTQTAVRLAIGATRAHIVTQALIESVLLSVAGGIAGLLVATGAAQLLLSLTFSTSTFLPISTRPSPLVLAFAFGQRAIDFAHPARANGAQDLVLPEAGACGQTHWQK